MSGSTRFALLQWLTPTAHGILMGRAVMGRVVVGRVVVGRGAGTERLNAATNQGLRFLAIAHGADELVETVCTALAPSLPNVERWGEHPSRGKSAQLELLGVASMSQEPSIPPNAQRRPLNAPSAATRVPFDTQ